MSEARTVLPIDIVALVASGGRVYPNEARPWERLGSPQTAPHPLETALEQWFSFATGKHAWISVRGATIRGMISARRRAKRSVWEVDCLIVADEDERVCLDLLARMSEGVTKAGAGRIFLRLPAESPIISQACETGFFAYGKNLLLRLERVPQLAEPNLELRPSAPQDLFGRYQLYNRTTPANVRFIEGMTLRDWQAAQEPWGGRPSEAVLEHDGTIIGEARWLGNDDRSRIVLALDPAHANRAPDLVAYAVRSLPVSGPVYCLVPAFAGHLISALQANGFAPASEYVTLARRTERLVEEAVPEQASSRIVVG
ncbi:MAG TPA: hypothetical protein VFB90_02250 [Dehalococcoidia bacterium]|nr:hypothetical protein [Dehalococcoidia bacterium]